MTTGTNKKKHMFQHINITQKTLQAASIIKKMQIINVFPLFGYLFIAL